MRKEDAENIGGLNSLETKEVKRLMRALFERGPRGKYSSYTFIARLCTALTRERFSVLADRRLRVPLLGANLKTRLSAASLNPQEKPWNLS